VQSYFEVIGRYGSFSKIISASGKILQVMTLQPFHLAAEVGVLLISSANRYSINLQNNKKLAGRTELADLSKRNPTAAL
jgi:hypothetical protein